MTGGAREETSVNWNTQLFRDVMAATPAPVTVVTAFAEHGPAGATVSAFMSVSLQPMLVAVSLRRSSRLLALIGHQQAFGINVLAESQAAIAAGFAQPRSNRYEDILWTIDHGQPRLAETAAWLVCDLDSAVEAGDHMILIARVSHGALGPFLPLVYSSRLFGTNSALRARARASVDLRVAALSRTAY